MLTDYRNGAAKYWESRRIIFNLSVLLAAWLGWGVSNAFNVGIDDVPGARVTDPGVLFSFVKLFAVMNAAFCIGYAAEFFCMADTARKWWPAPLRTILLIGLCALAMWCASSWAGSVAREAAYSKSGLGAP